MCSLVEGRMRDATNENNFEKKREEREILATVQNLSKQQKFVFR